MRYFGLFLLLAGLVTPSFPQTDSQGPSSEKANKTYKEGLEYLQRHATGPALDSFAKADKQDGGHCLGCQRQMVKYGIALQEWKSAETGAQELLSEAHTPTELALGHYHLGIVWMEEALEKHKDDLFSALTTS